jgi:hypothetical protein
MPPQKRIAPSQQEQKLSYGFSTAFVQSRPSAIMHRDDCQEAPTLAYCGPAAFGSTSAGSAIVQTGKLASKMHTN